MSLERTAQAPIAPEIADQAVRWLVELQAGTESESLRHAWENWRQEDPEHERAWQQIESVNERLKGLPGSLSLAVLAGPKKSGRRRALKLLGVIAAAGAAGWVAKDARLIRDWGADFATGVGERRTVQLVDGTSVVLNTDSAIDVIFDGARRRVRLVRGEIMVTTAVDRQSPPRAFLVETGEGTLRAIGTRFGVRLDGEATGIAVFEGAVELRPVDQPQATLIVPAGKQALLTREGYRDLLPLDEQSDAWTKGMIAVSGMPLGKFLAELSRHRSGRLACSPEIAQLRVSGTYPLGDTDRVLAALERALPIKIKRFTRYWVSVVPASSA